MMPAPCSHVGDSSNMRLNPALMTHKLTLCKLVPIQQSPPVKYSSLSSHDWLDAVHVGHANK